MKKICLLLIMGLTGCLYNYKPVVNQELIYSYMENMELFPKKLTSHFPPNLNTGRNYLYATSYMDNENIQYLYLIMHYSRKDTKEIKAFAESNAIRKYNLSDNCLLFGTYVPKHFEDSTINLNRCDVPDSDMLPVSSFKFLDTPQISEKFTKYADIYLLGAEQGNFIDSVSLSKTGIGLPKGWEHGYTKGVAIYGRTVAYWLEIW